MKNNYILIDYENVQPKSLSILNGYDFRVIIFIGANQTKIPFDLVSAVQEFGSNAKYIKIGENGPNALDFHIAFYMGQIAEKDPDAYFHVISKDTGFDPLIKHLRERKIFAQRETELAEIPLLRTSSAQSTEEKVAAIVERLTALGHARPRKVKTLKNSIHALFMKRLEEKELDFLVEQMRTQKLIIVEDEKISYQPPISQS